MVNIFRKALVKSGADRINGVLAVFKAQVNELNIGITDIKLEVNANTKRVVVAENNLKKLKVTTDSKNNRLNNILDQAVSVKESIASMLGSTPAAK